MTQEQTKGWLEDWEYKPMFGLYYKDTAPEGKKWAKVLPDGTCLWSEKKFPTGFEANGNRHVPKPKTKEENMSAKELQKQIDELKAQIALLTGTPVPATGKNNGSKAKAGGKTRGKKADASPAERPYIDINQKPVHVFTADEWAQYGELAPTAKELGVNAPKTQQIDVLKKGKKVETTRSKRAVRVFDGILVYSYKAKLYRANI